MTAILVESEVSEIGHIDEIKFKGGRGGWLGLEYQTTPRPQTPDKTAFVDWLAFTVKDLSLSEVHRALMVDFDLPELPWRETDRGWSGYEKKVDLGIYGWVAHGGESQNDTINVQLRPAACRNIHNIQAVMDWAERVQAKITRCDLAYDDYAGKTVNINKALEWKDEDAYKSNGRSPYVSAVMNFNDIDGNTIYVGKRKSGKLLRIYDKGKEQGDPESPWVRAEVEFRSKDRHIPWQVIRTPGKYLAGAYPCLAFINQVQEAIKTAKKSLSISYDKLVTWARTSCGRAINAMLIKEQGDIGQVIALLRREGLPRRLQSFCDIALDGVT